MKRFEPTSHISWEQKHLRAGLLRLAALSLLVILLGWLAWRWWQRRQPPAPLVRVATVAGIGPQLHSQDLSDPFGLALQADGTLLVSDGRGGRVYAIARNGTREILAENLDMPSALAVAEDGTVIVANTGDHTIVRLRAGRQEVLAGAMNQAGKRDGQSAQFNAPVGVAVDAAGLIYIADTYNDRICVVEPSGNVRTLAGGAGRGFADGRGGEARFDTPCGLAVMQDGSLLVADTGNHRIRRLTSDGAVTTLAGTGESDARDGALHEAAFAQPTAIAVRRDGALIVADADSSTLRLIDFGQPDKGIAASVKTLTGGYPYGLRDGAMGEARWNQPMGVAVNDDDVIFVADSGNGLVRALLSANKSLGRVAAAEQFTLSPPAIRQFVTQRGARWPFEPATARREIAGTFGEIRGEHAPAKNAWFHNGLDIPGAYGETVYALVTERVVRPLAIEDVGETRERLRLPLFGYTHLRLGRDQFDQPLPQAAAQGFDFSFSEVPNEKGMQTRQLTGVRLRRGATVAAGQAIGTLNRLNHVHLIAGPPSAEVNALAALPLPGITDLIAPTIERVDFVASDDATFNVLAPVSTPRAARNAKNPRAGAAVAPLVLRGQQRIIVTAYDQADGNASYRRLGLYRLGYRVLRATGEVAASTAPQATQPAGLNFDRLPLDPRAPLLVYAPGSQSGYTERTIFAYEVTNELRAGVAQAGVWDTTQYAVGDYVMEVFAEDFFGNRTQRQVSVSIER